MVSTVKLTDPDITMVPVENDRSFATWKDTQSVDQSRLTYSHSSNDWTPPKDKGLQKTHIKRSCLSNRCVALSTLFLGSGDSRESFGQDLECHATHMTIHIPRSLASNAKLYMRDKHCELRDNGTHFVLTFTYDSCGTSLMFYQDHMLAQNNVTVHLDIDTEGPIQFDSDYTIPLQCRVPRDHQVGGAFMAVTRDPVVEDEGEATTAEFVLREFKSALYREEITEYPLQVNLDWADDLYHVYLGTSPLSWLSRQISCMMCAVYHVCLDRYPVWCVQISCTFGVWADVQYDVCMCRCPDNIPINKELFFEIDVQDRHQTGVAVFVSWCDATPTPDATHPLAYRLVENGCPASAAVHLEPVPSPDRFRFRSQAFHFSGDSNNNNQVYVHCSVKVCPARQCQTACRGDGLKHTTKTPTVASSTMARLLPTSALTSLFPAATTIPTTTATIPAAASATFTKSPTTTLNIITTIPARGNTKLATSTTITSTTTATIPTTTKTTPTTRTAAPNTTTTSPPLSTSTNAKIRRRRESQAVVQSRRAIGGQRSSRPERSVMLTRGPYVRSAHTV
ncbi:hypothetical protein PoB_002706700 [Plakobranchus ocellatus]|uniref:ZP domain-containing protein n=1 Tax=Plakobranchus ocellatus TaxID=259542 RepID=A0AAV3ZZW0_9GAST|nr:hypothetical protein PoB_002706700 [Plakobranchus ocellatus]